MELQALLVLCGVGVAGLAVLLLMGLFSASGTSYEEAMAQQRKAATELLSLAENKNKPKKNVKKANKKLAKKEKSKENSTVVAAAGNEQDSETLAESGVDEDSVPSMRPHVEFSPAIVVDVPRDTPNVKIRKRGKDPKVKPILLNKEDPSCVSDPSAPPSPDGNNVSNHFEEIHPKDEFELMHRSLAAEKVAERKEELVEKKESKSKQGKAKTTPKQAAPVEISKEEESQRERHNSGELPKEQRKAKKAEKKSQVEEQVESREEVVPPLNIPQPSELTTEKLLKQALAPTVEKVPIHSTPPGKGKKKKQETNVLSLIGDAGGVNVSELVRLVSDAALSRTEIQILTDALLNKQHELLPQHSEWTEGPNDPMQKLKKQLADKEKALSDELEASQAIHAKLKELRASLNAERSRAAAATRAAEEASGEALALQTRLQRLTDEKQALAQEKMRLQSKLSAEGEAQAQRVQMEMHIQRLSESETALVAQCNALQAEASARVMEAGQARCEAAAARDAALLAQQHAAELAQQLQEANRVCAELDVQRQNAIHSEQTLQQDLRQLQERLNALSELQAELQRATSRAQLAETNLDKVTEESEKQKQKLLSELSSVKEQLSLRESELAELKQMKATLPAQNGLPSSNSSDSHKAAELAKVEGVIETLRAELASAQRNSSEQKDQVARLHEQLKQYQNKNNEAVSKAQETQYREVAAVLKAACPQVAPSTTPSRAWLEAFADGLKRELEQAKSVPVTSSADASRLDEVRAQNEHLQALVDKYKRIINDTEGVLSQLQHNVTAEEQRWARQLADKQRELDELRQRTVTQMQNKIDLLEAELRQAQAANHSHSFANVERNTEERLMESLSDKHKLDSCNGPLQLEVAEK